MARKKRKKNMEFSKKILYFVGIVNVIVIVFSIVLMWRTMDTTPLCYLIPSVAAKYAQLNQTALILVLKTSGARDGMGIDTSALRQCPSVRKFISITGQ